MQTDATTRAASCCRAVASACCLLVAVQAYALTREQPQTPTIIVMNSELVVAGHMTGRRHGATWEYETADEQGRYLRLQQVVTRADFMVTEVIDGIDVQPGDVLTINVRGGTHEGNTSPMTVEIPAVARQVVVGLQRDRGAARRGFDGYVIVAARIFDAPSSHELGELRSLVGKVRRATAAELDAMVQLERSGEPSGSGASAEAPAAADAPVSPVAPAPSFGSPAVAEREDPVMSAPVVTSPPGEKPVLGKSWLSMLVALGMLAALAALVYAVRRNTPRT